MNIIQSSFDSVDIPLRRPLMIGSSGGAGHNSAIQGLYHYLKNKYGENIEFPNHMPILYSTSSPEATKHPIKRKIDTGVRLMHNHFMSGVIKIIAEPFYPILPTLESIGDEIDTLNKKEEKLTEGRFYVDMLLDAFPAGYESVAIWNVLQRNDKVQDLKKLIDRQSEVDEENYKDTYDFYYDKLLNAYQSNKPYTEIISSQAMALPALCDAVIDYNKIVVNSGDVSVHEVVIHEYVIELPTAGAVYYFQGLSKLTSEQQLQMKLYAVNIDEDFVRHFSSQDTKFSGLYAVPKDDNPLVRPGFTNSQLDNSEKFSVDCKITLAGNVVYNIAAEEQIASIMLGSQAGNDTVEYIESLLKSNMDKVFVFGGQNPNISARIDTIIEKNPTYAEKIVKLGNQGDKEIAALMTRSNMLVIRAGALSTQEQLAMKHNPLQSVFIHHANSKSEVLTSGLAWEDANADALMTDLRSLNVHTEKTSPDRAKRHFAEACLIVFAKKNMSHGSIKTWDSESIAQYIRTIPNTDLYSWINDLANSKENNTVHEDLQKHFETYEEIAAIQVTSLIGFCEGGKSCISLLIKKALGLSEDISIEDIFSKPEKYPAPSDENSKCYALYKNYTAITALLDTLSPTDVSASKKLRDFKTKYASKEIKNDLLDYQNSTLQLIFIKIKAVLAKVFPSITNYFTFEDHIDRISTEMPEETNRLIPG